MEYYIQDAETMEIERYREKPRSNVNQHKSETRVSNDDLSYKSKLRCFDRKKEKMSLMQQHKKEKIAGRLQYYKKLQQKLEIKDPSFERIVKNILHKHPEVTDDELIENSKELREILHRANEESHKKWKSECRKIIDELDELSFKSKYRSICHELQEKLLLKPQHEKKKMMKQETTEEIVDILKQLLER